jgi:hypothetical protein
MLLRLAERARLADATSAFDVTGACSFVAGSTTASSPDKAAQTTGASLLARVRSRSLFRIASGFGGMTPGAFAIEAADSEGAIAD